MDASFWSAQLQQALHLCKEWEQEQTRTKLVLDALVEFHGRATLLDAAASDGGDVLGVLQDFEDVVCASRARLLLHPGMEFLSMLLVCHIYVVALSHHLHNRSSSMHWLDFSLSLKHLRSCWHVLVVDKYCVRANERWIRVRAHRSRHYNKVA
eukprot:2488817-Pleurochrysis_carterae.AAC.2